MPSSICSKILLAALLPLLSPNLTAAAPAEIAPGAIVDMQSLPDGILFQTAHGAMRLQFVTESIVHFSYSPASQFPIAENPALLPQAATVQSFKITPLDKEIRIENSTLRIHILRKNAAVAIDDANGKPLLREEPEGGGKSLRPRNVEGGAEYEATDLFLPEKDEAFYGLGQHQSGVWDYSGESVDLSQDNTNISIPFFVSSRGYGVFWNNTSRSRFNSRFAQTLYLWSEFAHGVDYYFLYGTDLDRVIREYRQLTGSAPLFGKWAYGFWQCKNRYASQEELLTVAAKYRALHLPVDNIVQDWFWWTKMGSHIFNEHYPDPAAMVDSLHQQHFHVMISVWPFFEPGTENYREFEKQGWFLSTIDPSSNWLPGASLYDAFDPGARQLYWKQIEHSLFSKGFDAWWLDTTEPETIHAERNSMLHAHTGIGAGADFANVYPLMTTMGVFEGQRKANDAKRVFILTRSGYAGMQRNGAVSWSGDIFSSWKTLQRQIPAGLNFALSGMPYWTTDIGGFTTANPDSPAYRELFVRWFEYGTFCPIFRVHGTRTPDQNELWSYGPEAQQTLVKFDELRYRLLPYIYSLAWRVTGEGYTLMRPLVMDFREDPRSQRVSDQFLFGPSLLVNPVTEAGQLTRNIYLPPGVWFDFWTGAETKGGHDLQVGAPLDSIPLFVRAGSILPMGPKLEYADQHPADPLEIRIYPGADGDFSLYEDEGDGYGYEKGAHATIALHWQDNTRQLSIAARQGTFPGMLKEREFRVVWVREHRGIGAEPSPTVDLTAHYTGAAVTLQQPAAHR